MGGTPPGGSGGKGKQRAVTLVFFPKKRRTPESAPSRHSRTITLTIPGLPGSEGARPGSTEQVTEPDLRALNVPAKATGSAAGEETPPRARSPKAREEAARAPGESDEDTTHSETRSKSGDAGSKRKASKAPGPAHGGTPVSEDVRARQARRAIRGMRLFEKGEYHEARLVLESVVAEGPDEPFPYTMLGTVYLALGVPDLALALFEAALGLNPDDLAARVYRGEIRLGHGKRKAAISDLKHALSVGAPKDPFVQRARKLLRRAEAGT